MSKNDMHNPPGPVNPDFQFRKSVSRDLEYYIRGLKQQNKFILSEAITLAESANESKNIRASALLDWAFECRPSNTLRMSVTGTPGVGKSTFIESFGKLMVANGHKLSVLPVDPSSQISGGSILGDKTRMAELSQLKEVFIRPSPSGGTLGGTSLHTKEAIMLSESAGYTTTIIETVGVGQSETEAYHMTDVTILLLQPGAGDEIQGIKRGIMENADIVLINKADGQQLLLAKETQKHYQNALQFFHHPINEWKVPVLLISSISGNGMEEVIQVVQNYISLSKNLGHFHKNRQMQEERWFRKQVFKLIEKWFYANSRIKTNFEKLATKIKKSEISTPSALRKMIHIFESEVNKT